MNDFLDALMGGQEKVAGWIRIIALLSKDVPADRVADRDIAIRFCRSSLMLGEHPPTSADFSGGGYSFGHNQTRVLVKNGCMAVSRYDSRGNMVERDEVDIEDYEASANHYQNEIRKKINHLCMDRDAH